MTGHGLFLRIIPRDSIWHHLVRFLVMPLIAVIALFFLVDSVIMPAVTRQGEEFALPDVVGMSITDARGVFENAGIEAEIAGEEPSPNLPEGTVIGQTPLPGSMVKEGRRVKLMISAGQRMVNVPSMVGYSQRQAELRLREAGLKAGSLDWAVGDSMQFANVLVYSVPSEGSLVPTGTAINLFFSRGAQRDIVFVPDLVGLNLDDAQRVVDSLGLNISKVDYAVTMMLLPRTVMWQSVPAGNRAAVGSAIALKVSVTN